MSTAPIGSPAPFAAGAEDSNEYCSLVDAARLLRVSRATLWRWIRAGRLPALRVGPRTIRVRRADLEALQAPVQTQAATLPKHLSEARTPALSQPQSDLQPLTEEQAEAAIEALRHREQLIQKLLANFPNGSVNVFDRDFRYLLAEGKGLAQVGLSSEQLIGRTLAEVFPPEAVDYVAPYYRRAFAGESVQFELPLAGHWYSIHADPLWDRHGETFAILAVAQDVTEQKEAIQTARRQAELLDLAHDVVLVLDPENRITFWNRSAEQVYGWLAQEAIGRVAYELLQTRFPTSFADVRTSLNETGHWEGELIHTRRDGGQLVVATRWGLQRDDRGQPAAVLEIIRDITEQKRAEEERERLLAQEQQARAEAQDALRARDDFISLVTHELRTPITSLKAYAQLMQRRASYSERAVATFITQTNQLERLVTDLSDASRLEPGQLELRRQQVDIIPLARAAAEQIRTQASGHTIFVRAPAGPLEGWWDPDRIAQVLQNLLSNAIKYSPEGGEIFVEIEDLGGEVSVSVRDQGVGIPSDVLPRIFERFYRAEATARDTRGLGIGLFVTRGLIQAHGGRISVQSTPGQGSTFTFTLPYTRPPAA